ncbi:T9SS type A sorting domain-containing protein [Mesoflavibacter sp.]|uniref:T9SS type A sorting domain-containing protein n=1 Tax=Mesoflavibacter sp. TaxID=1930902 RepID=UPI0035117349
MKNILHLVTILFVTTLIGQNGDTINDAIPIDGTMASIDILNYNSASNSGLAPACISADDVFYKHTVNVGDNKMTIGMASAGLAVITDVEYQIFKAPQGDIGQLQELDCNAYTVFVLVGGSFQFVIDDTGTSNTYYLRVYKNSDSGINLSSLLGGTSITMKSEFDATLSTDTKEFEDTKIVTKENKLEILGNKSFTSSTIYALTGQEIYKEDNTEDIDIVDISQLNTGIYVLVLENENTSITHKFIKR